MKSIFDKIKDKLSGNEIPNPLGIPAPLNSTTLFIGTPESIIKQYISMRDKTNSLFQYAKDTGSVVDYCEATMRYSAYSSACVFGLNLFFVCNKYEVGKIIPEKLNRLIYGKILLDIADFSWLMLLYNFEKSEKTNLFDKEKITEFLNSDHTPEIYWTVLFSFIVSGQNAEFAYQHFKTVLEKTELFEPEKLENLPSEQTKKAFDQMIALNIIGNPDEYCLFDAKSIIDTIGAGPTAINEQRVSLENSLVAEILTPEVKLHLLSNF